MKQQLGMDGIRLGCDLSLFLLGHTASYATETLLSLPVVRRMKTKIFRGTEL
jgi:hypothetical protein